MNQNADVIQKDAEDELMPTLDSEMRAELQAIREGRFVGKTYTDTDEMFRDILGEDWRERNEINRENIKTV